jgi:hypothetical protein
MDAMRKACNKVRMLSFRKTKRLLAPALSSIPNGGEGDRIGLISPSVGELANVLAFLRATAETAARRTLRKVFHNAKFPLRILAEWA